MKHRYRTKEQRSRSRRHTSRNRSKDTRPRIPRLQDFSSQEQKRLEQRKEDFAWRPRWVLERNQSPVPYRYRRSESSYCYDRSYSRNTLMQEKYSHVSNFKSSSRSIFHHEKISRKSEKNDKYLKSSRSPVRCKELSSVRSLSVTSTNNDSTYIGSGVKSNQDTDKTARSPTRIKGSQHSPVRIQNECEDLVTRKTGKIHRSPINSKNIKSKSSGVGQISVTSPRYNKDIGVSSREQISECYQYRNPSPSPSIAIKPLSSPINSRNTKSSPRTPRNPSSSPGNSSNSSHSARSLGS